MKPGAIIIIALLTAGFALVPAGARAHAEDDPLLVKLMLDQLEKRVFGNDSEDSWEADAWIGKDLHKLWLKSKGERAFSRTDEAELQLLFGKAVSTYWDFQAGIRHDFRPSPSRKWLAIGFHGLAPYFFKIDTALFIGEAGRTAVRAQAEYDLLLTQRLVLTPQFEANLYGKNDPAIGIGSGLSDIEVGLRLRYEIRRELAPYIGIHWSREYGRTADFSRAAGEFSPDTRFTAGLRVWF